MSHDYYDDVGRHIPVSFPAHRDPQPVEPTGEQRWAIERYLAANPPRVAVPSPFLIADDCFDVHDVPVSAGAVAWVLDEMGHR